MKVARIYLRVSADDQDLARQAAVVDQAKAAGFYVAGVYREKASGARPDRPELLRLIDDLQSGEVVVSEKIDRISRLPLEEAERLVASIRAKGAKLAVPGVVDLSELAAEAKGVAKVVLESVQDMLLKLALQIARDDYEDRRERQRQGVELAKQAGKYRGRKADTATHQRIVALRGAGETIERTADLAGCSISQVKRVWAIHQAIRESAAVPDRRPSSIKLIVRLYLENGSKFTRGKKRAREDIEQFALYPFNPTQRNDGRYELTVPFDDDSDLERRIDELLREVHRSGEAHNCVAECTLYDPNSDRYWE